ncbi:unnamed protein product [Durusdinium trenchii]|uniref:Uncharacterized protein n=2 Tax=Durusdinium trenchii TaxID=1381693 RepID=A0ABP0MIV5_9DINO
MGAALCSEAPLPHPRVHVCRFPMYVVKVSDFLQMTGTPEAHDSLLQKGLLHQWEPGMFTLFVSHQWLGSQHPDPAGQQLGVLRVALRRILEQSLQVEEDLTSMTPSARLAPERIKRLSPQTLQRIERGYLFVDWFAIPQITARKHGINEDDTRSNAARAVQSIPAYVEAADLFLALVPELPHADTGLTCSYTSWLSRGWCRAELWCRLLSNKPDTSIIVIYSTGEAELMFPLDWQRNLIADGRFTVESDRAVVVKLGEAALASKLETLRSEGPVSHYRFYLACRPRLLGQQPVTLDSEDFLRYFHFPSLRAAAEGRSCRDGLTGLLCAVLAGNAHMIRMLAKYRADVNDRLGDLSELGYYETQTMLMAAAKSHQEPLILETLIELRADVHAQARSGIGCTFVVRSAGQVQCLLAFRADFEGKVSAAPLNGAASRADTATVAALLAAKCEPDYPVHAKYGALTAAALFGRGNPCCASNVRLLLEHQALVDRRARPVPPLAEECALAGEKADEIGLEQSSTLVRTWGSLPGMTPLHAAALVGNSKLVRSLLEYRAQLLMNDRGNLPHELAQACGHTHLLPLLETFYI